MSLEELDEYERKLDGQALASNSTVPSPSPSPSQVPNPAEVLAPGKDPHQSVMGADTSTPYSRGVGLASLAGKQAWQGFKSGALFPLTVGSKLAEGNVEGAFRDVASILALPGRIAPVASSLLAPIVGKPEDRVDPEVRRRVMDMALAMKRKPDYTQEPEVPRVQGGDDLYGAVSELAQLAGGIPGGMLGMKGLGMAGKYAMGKNPVSGIPVQAPDVPAPLPVETVTQPKSAPLSSLRPSPIDVLRSKMQQAAPTATEGKPPLTLDQLREWAPETISVPGGEITFVDHTPEIEPGYPPTVWRPQRAVLERATLPFPENEIALAALEEPRAPAIELGEVKGGPLYSGADNPRVVEPPTPEVLTAPSTPPPTVPPLTAPAAPPPAVPTGPSPVFAALQAKLQDIRNRLDSGQLSGELEALPERAAAAVEYVRAKKAGPIVLEAIERGEKTPLIAEKLAKLSGGELDPVYAKKILEYYINSMRKRGQKSLDIVDKTKKATSYGKSNFRPAPEKPGQPEKKATSRSRHRSPSKKQDDSKTGDLESKARQAHEFLETAFKQESKTSEPKKYRDSGPFAKRKSQGKPVRLVRQQSAPFYQIG